MCSGTSLISNDSGKNEAFFRRKHRRKHCGFQKGHPTTLISLLKLNSSPIFEKPRVCSPNSRKWDFFSACCDARPKNLKPHCSAAFNPVPKLWSQMFCAFVRRSLKTPSTYGDLNLHTPKTPSAGRGQSVVGTELQVESPCGRCWGFASSRERGGWRFQGRGRERDRDRGGVHAP